MIIILNTTLISDNKEMHITDLQDIDAKSDYLAFLIMINKV